MWIIFAALDWTTVLVSLIGAALTSGGVAGILRVLYQGRIKKAEALAKIRIDEAAQKAKSEVEDRADALREYKELYDKQEKQIDRLTANLDKERKERQAGQNELETLRKLVHRLRDTQMGNIPLGGGAMIIADMSNKILQASPGVAPLFHYLPAELEGQSITILMTPEVARMHNRAVKRSIQNHGSFSGEVKRIVSKARQREGGIIDVVIYARWFQVAPGRYLMSAVISEVIKNGSATDVAGDTVADEKNYDPKQTHEGALLGKTDEAKITGSETEKG